MLTQKQRLSRKCCDYLVLFVVTCFDIRENMSAVIKEVDKYVHHEISFHTRRITNDSLNTI